MQALRRTRRLSPFEHRLADGLWKGFASAREFALFLGLTPRQNSSGGKKRLGRITKMGDRYLRKPLVVGACSVLFRRKGHADALRRWADQLIARKPGPSGFKLAAVALANKLARIVFALLTRGGDYTDRPSRPEADEELSPQGDTQSTATMG